MNNPLSFRATPTTNEELAYEFAVLVGHIAAVTRGTDDPNVVAQRLFDKGAQFLPDESPFCTWVSEIMPHLDDLDWGAGDDGIYDLAIPHSDDGFMVTFTLPKVLAYVDDPNNLAAIAPFELQRDEDGQVYWLESAEAEHRGLDFDRKVRQNKEVA